MRSTSTKSALQTAAEVIVALIAWFSLAMQLYLTQGSILNYFSYFTILSNILIAVSLTFSSLSPSSKAGIFFSKLTVQSGILLYIFIVGLVYNTVLRGIWMPEGLQWMVDNLLHVVMPVLYILFWFIFRTKGVLKWQDGIYWMLFPFFYLVYSLLRGAYVKWYPYPFLDANKLGYEKVWLNIVLMILAFFVAGLLVIAANRALGKRANVPV